MQTTAHARRPPLFTRHAVVAALIGLPVLPLAGGSQSIPSETKYAVAYTGVAVRLLFWSLNQKVMERPLQSLDRVQRRSMRESRERVQDGKILELHGSILRESFLQIRRERLRSGSIA